MKAISCLAVFLTSMAFSAPLMAGGAPVNGSILELPACSGWVVRCFGTEPFWSLEFGANGATWTEVDNQANPAQMSYSQTSHTGGTVPVSGFSTSTGIAGTISYVPTRDCSDGSSDFLYAFRLNLSALPVQSGGVIDLDAITSAQAGQPSLCCRLVAP